MIPYKRVTLRSSAAVQPILQQIASGHDPEFTGRQLPDGTFELKRRIRYRNSFLPLIHASVHGSHVTLVMRMHTLMTIFIALWVAVSLLLGLVAWFAAREWLVLLFPLFGYLTAMVGFLPEARNAERRLRAKLHA